MPEVSPVAPTRSWGRAAFDDYRALDLRVHEILRQVPLHDVWQVELPGGAPGLSLADVRPLLGFERMTSASPAVHVLFRVRGLLGRLLLREPADPTSTGDPRSFLPRLSREDLARSVIEPGSSEGPFTVLYAHERESASEIINTTVHAFSVLALQPRSGGYRLFWAIYVESLGWWTSLYIALIDPFRRWIVYPAVLRHLHRSWLLGAPVE